MVPERQEFLNGWWLYLSVQHMSQYLVSLQQWGKGLYIFIFHRKFQCFNILIDLR